MGTIFTICFFIILFLWAGIFIKPIYYFIWENKEWRNWRYFIKNIDKFEYECEFLGTHYFRWGNYSIAVWNNGLASVHDEETNECICGFFNEHLSNKVAMMFLNKLKKNG